MINIRPHHILCMRAYIGNGYSEEFKSRMEDTIKQIKAYNEFLQVNNDKKELKEINLICSTDSLCEKCPNKLGQNICKYQEKVSLLDSKVVKYFNLHQGIHYYGDLEYKIYNNITEEIFDDICKECEWYKTINCKEYIINT